MHYEQRQYSANVKKLLERNKTISKGHCHFQPEAKPLELSCDLSDTTQNLKGHLHFQRLFTEYCNLSVT